MHGPELADSWPNIDDEVELRIGMWSYVKRTRLWFEAGWKGRVLNIDRAIDNEGKLRITPCGVQVDFGRRKEHKRRGISITWTSKYPLKKPENQK